MKTATVRVESITGEVAARPGCPGGILSSGLLRLGVGFALLVGLSSPVLAHAADADAAAAKKPLTRLQKYGDGGFDAAVVHTFNGAMIGLYACESQFGCGGDEEMASMAAGAAIGGLGGYLVGSQFARADVMMVNTGMIIGMFGGIVSADLAIEKRYESDDWDFDRDAVQLQHRLIGEALGGALFGGLAALLQPTPAQVSMANSTGWWALFLGAMAHTGRDRSPGAIGSAATFGVGFAGGMMLYNELRFARISTWKVDLGGILGIVGGQIWVSQANDRSDAAAARAMMTGSLLGLAAGTWIALADDRVTEQTLPVALGFVPQDGGGAVSVSGQF